MFLPGESQGRGSLVGCRLWGLTELGTTEATQRQQGLVGGELFCRLGLSFSEPVPRTVNFTSVSQVFPSLKGAGVGYFPFPPDKLGSDKAPVG